MNKYLIAAVLTMCLAGCGLKGELNLPQEEASVKADVLG